MSESYRDEDLSNSAPPPGRAREISSPPSGGCARVEWPASFEGEAIAGSEGPASLRRATRGRRPRSLAGGLRTGQRFQVGDRGIAKSHRVIDGIRGRANNPQRSRVTPHATTRQQPFGSKGAGSGICATTRTECGGVGAAVRKPLVGVSRRSLYDVRSIPIPIEVQSKGLSSAANLFDRVDSRDQTTSLVRPIVDWRTPARNARAARESGRSRQLYQAGCANVGSIADSRRLSASLRETPSPTSGTKTTAPSENRTIGGDGARPRIRSW